MAKFPALPDPASQSHLMRLTNELKYEVCRQLLTGKARRNTDNSITPGVTIVLQGARDIVTLRATCKSMRAFINYFFSRAVTAELCKNGVPHNLDYLKHAGLLRNIRNLQCSGWQATFRSSGLNGLHDIFPYFETLRSFRLLHTDISFKGTRPKYRNSIPKLRLSPFVLDIEGSLAQQVTLSAPQEEFLVKEITRALSEDSRY